MAKNTSAPPYVLEAAARLLRGETVAVPTDTVWGLAARADCAKALEGLGFLKERPAGKAYPVHVASVAEAWKIGQPTAGAVRLAEAFWPGGVTLVLESQEENKTVAVRVPGHALWRAVLQVCAVPVAVPSANRSGEVPAENYKRVQNAFPTVWTMPGVCGGAEASTLVDATGLFPVVLRAGAVSIAEILRAWDPL